MPALAHAARSTAICAAGLGAIKPLDRPSWLTAEPRTTASTRFPSRCASANRLSTTTPQPSPRTNPSAPASNAWQRPVGDIASARSKLRVIAGDNSRFTPAAMASVESPTRRLWQARCNRDQRRRTCRVDDDRGATQVEEVRQPVGDDAERAAGAGPCVDLAEVLRRQISVLAQARVRRRPPSGCGVASLAGIPACSRAS